MGIQDGQIDGPQRLADIFGIGHKCVGEPDIDRHFVHGPDGTDLFLCDDGQYAGRG
ncbi:MAG: hypothetical protein MZV70_68930 [Desulfobacterales bacterium]|nr:hypothetical protein [Desulfobacterales bacterium]